MPIFLIVGLFFGFIAGAFLLYHPRLPGSFGRLWMRYVVRPGKLVELLGVGFSALAFVAAAGAAFLAYRQIDLSESVSKRQLRADVLFEKAEIDQENRVVLTFKNYGETPALALQTTCTFEMISADEFAKRSNGYGGSKKMGAYSDRGKDQAVQVRNCDGHSASIMPDTSTSYVWAGVTYLDIFQRCQHAWVLLKQDHRDFSIVNTESTDPEFWCVYHPSASARSAAFP